MVGFCLRLQHGSRAAAEQRKGWVMLEKTKAALQSCQCHYQKIKQSQGTRVNAGGQNSEKAMRNHSGSLAFLRCRRLISPSIAEVTNCPVLSPSAFRFSIASTKQSGTRASIRFDLAFTDLVAISEFRCIWCPTIIIEIKYNSSLDVSHTLLLACVQHLGFKKVKNGNAPDCRSSTEASNHNVIGANNMADLQHTQTRPEFIRPKHVNHAEKAITQIVHAKAILALIASQDTNSAAVENALEAITEMLERAEEELAEVRHA